MPAPGSGTGSMNLGKGGLPAARAKEIRAGKKSAAPPAAPYCKNRLREIRGDIPASPPQLPHQRLSRRRQKNISLHPRSAIRENTDAQFGTSVVSRSTSLSPRRLVPGHRGRQSLSDRRKR